jgi:hypothetical protein
LNSIPAVNITFEEGLGFGSCKEDEEKEEGCWGVVYPTAQNFRSLFIQRKEMHAIFSISVIKAHFRWGPGSKYLAN